MSSEDLLRELAQARGPSGAEDGIRALAAEKLKPFSDDVHTDALGNLIALKRGEGPEPRPSVMLAAHMDEICLMVSGLEKGFIRFTNVGGFDARVLLGQCVLVHGRRDLRGVVVSVPPHFTKPEAWEKPVPLDKLFVDVGLPPTEVESLVSVGDLMTIEAGFTRLAGGYAASKSLDDRAGLTAVTMAMEGLGRRRHTWDVYAAATVQEEIGTRGAIAGAYHLAPTIAVAIDVTFGQQPGFSSPETVKTDGGPCIALGPNMHPGIHDRLTEAAMAADIPYQVEPLPGNSGTDAWPIQVSRGGIPTGLVEIPVRYMHSAIETAAVRDIERAARLLAEFISRLDAEFAGTLCVRDALAPDGGKGGPA